MDKKFWDIRSRTFHGYDEKDEYRRNVLETARELGVVFKGKRVLDAGCGAGAYTIALSYEAYEVTALDISSGMLGRVKADADRLGLTNIKFIEGAFLDYITKQNMQRNENGAFREAAADFDVVFASLTPALGNEEALENLFAFKDAAVVSVSFAAPMRAHSLEVLFKAHGVDVWRHQSPKEPLMKLFLEERGILYKTRILSGTWVNVRTKQEMLDNFTDLLTARQVPPDSAKVLETAELYKTAEDSYTVKTDYVVEIMVWRVS